MGSYRGVGVVGVVPVRQQLTDAAAHPVMPMSARVLATMPMGESHLARRQHGSIGVRPLALNPYVGMSYQWWLAIFAGSLHLRE